MYMYAMPATISCCAFSIATATQVLSDQLYERVSTVLESHGLGHFSDLSSAEQITLLDEAHRDISSENNKVRVSDRLSLLLVFFGLSKRGDMFVTIPGNAVYNRRGGSEFLFVMVYKSTHAFGRQSRTAGKQCSNWRISQLQSEPHDAKYDRHPTFPTPSLSPPLNLEQVYKAFESQFGKSMDAEIAKEARQGQRERER